MFCYMSLPTSISQTYNLSSRCEQHCFSSRIRPNVTPVCKISTSVTQDTPSISKLCNSPSSPQSRTATRWIPTAARSQYRRACLNLDQGISDREVMDDWFARAHLPHNLALPLPIWREDPIGHLVSDRLDPRPRCRLDIAHIFRLHALCHQVRTSHLLGHPRRNLP
jgi:hypothetical protein